MNNINRETTLKLIKSIDVTDLAGEKVMIDFETGKYFLLKGSANEIWDILSQTTEKISVSEIVHTLTSIYEVSETVCEEAVISFLNQLLTLNFITIC